MHDALDAALASTDMIVPDLPPVSSRAQLSAAYREAILPTFGPGAEKTGPGQRGSAVQCSGRHPGGSRASSLPPTHTAPARRPRPARQRTRAPQRARPRSTNSFIPRPLFPSVSWRRQKRAGTGWHQPGATQHTATARRAVPVMLLHAGAIHAPAHLTRRPTAGSTSLPTICSSRVEDLRNSPSRASELMSAQDLLCPAMHAQLHMWRHKASTVHVRAQFKKQNTTNKISATPVGSCTWTEDFTGLLLGLF